VGFVFKGLRKNFPEMRISSPIREPVLLAIPRQSRLSYSHRKGIDWTWISERRMESFCLRLRNILATLWPPKALIRSLEKRNDRQDWSPPGKCSLPLSAVSPLFIGQLSRTKLEQ
jgi:hypothetical protein